MHKLTFALALALSPAFAATQALAEPVKVVASFSILADMAREIGGADVSVTALVGPNEDAHVYEPTPADAVALAGADLILVNGLGFEGFIDRLVEASGTQAPVIIAARAVEALETAQEAHEEGEHDHSHDHAHDHAHDHDHDHGPLDPHAWQSLDAARLYVAQIAEGLCDVRPQTCASFEANAGAYDARILALQGELEALMSPIPREARIVIASHDAFAYLARDFDLTFLAAQGLSTDAQASAAGVASLIDQIRDTGARALFVENVSDPRLVEQIASETGLSVSGRLYSDALSGPDGPAATYLDMMRNNVSLIANALSGS